MSSENTQRIMVTLTEDELEWVDEISKRFRMTRSQVLGKCVEDSKETLEMIEALGLKPERIAKVMELFYGFWNLRSPQVKILKGDKVQVT